MATVTTETTMNSYVDEDSKRDRRYQRFLKKAEVYLNKYQASHGSQDVATRGGVDGSGTRHLDFMKKAHGFFNKKEGKGNGEQELSKKDDNKKETVEHNQKEYLTLATAMLKKIHKHKKHNKKHGKYHGGGGGHGEGEGEEEEEEESEEEEEVEEVEEGEEGGWFSQLLEGIGSIGEAFEE